MKFLHRKAYALAACSWAATLTSSVVAHAQNADNSSPGSQRVGENGSEPQPGQRVITPPKLVNFVEAAYPEEEKAAGKEADVVLQIGIADTGTVVAVAVLESAGPAFDAAAVAAAKQFVFEPARVNGKPTPVKINYKYAFTIKQEVVKRTTADFEGQIRDRQTKKPIANVKVGLETGQFAVTDAEGKFRIADVAEGEHTITLSGDQLTQIGTVENFEAGKKLDATYDVELKANVPGDDDSDFEVVVTAPRIGKQVVSTEIPAEQGRQVPGTQGDVLKVVENLPGVARAAVGSGALVVWGAAPEDTRVYVEGMRVPRLYHDGGYRSTIHSDFVRSVELVPGGYGAQYGRGRGGLVQVQLKGLDEEKFHGSVGVDVIDASAAIRTPVTDKLNIAISGRHGHIYDVISAFGGNQNVGAVVPLPRYWDSQARAVYHFSRDERVEIGGLVSSDQTDYNLIDADPASSKTESRRTNYGRVYLRYEKRLENGEQISVMPWYGHDSIGVLNKFGATPATLDNDSNVFGLRSSWKGQPEKWLAVAAGVDIELVASSVKRQGSITTPPREGDIRVFGQAPSDSVNTDTWHTMVGSLAPFAEADFGMLDDKLHIVPGIRFEPYLISGDKATPVQGSNPAVGYSSMDVAIEPRLAARYDILPRLTLKAAFGLYHQPPVSTDLSSVFGNPTLPLSRAIHVLAGAAAKITDSMTAEVTGFSSFSNDLAARNTASTPELARALLPTAIGRSYGMQAMLRQEKVGPFFGWVSYSLIRSERRNTETSDWRLFDYDQTHVLTTVAAFDLGNGWEVGGRIRVATGFPRTPVTGAFYNSRADIYSPQFGPQNSTRIPTFFQADVRGSKRFRLSQTSEIEVYLDLQNVTYTRNPEEIVYNFDYSQQGYITGLPILPDLGVRWTF